MVETQTAISSRKCLVPDRKVPGTKSSWYVLTSVASQEFKKELKLISSSCSANMQKNEEPLYYFKEL